MPGPLTQQAIEGYPSLPLPKTWAETYKLKGYWERKAELEQLPACEQDEDEAFEAEMAQWEGRRD